MKLTSEDIRFLKPISFSTAGASFAVVLALLAIDGVKAGENFPFACSAFAVAFPFQVMAGVILHPMREDKAYSPPTRWALFACFAVAAGAFGVGIAAVFALLSLRVLAIFSAAGVLAVLLMSYACRRIRREND